MKESKIDQEPNHFPSNPHQEQSFHKDQYQTKSKHMLIQTLNSQASFQFIDNQEKLYFNIKAIRFTPNFQVLRLQVQMGGFLTEIVVLNSYLKSNIHNLHNISQTTSSVYIHPSLLPNAVIKCIPINNNKPFTDNLFRVIKQYIIYKLSSVLKIGPPLYNIFGFDLVIYDHCIQFSMEKCSPLCSLHAHQFNQIQEKLYRLHQLQIVHLDIKPSNICWSPSLEQLVFIDYGLSDILDEKIGYKTEAVFVGSLNYCSYDLLQCYTSPQQNFKVDLYHNDLYCLQRSFSQLRGQVKAAGFVPLNQEFFAVQPQMQTQIKQAILWMQVRHKIFNSCHQVLKRSELKTYMKGHVDKVFAFCKSLPQSQLIQQIYTSLKQQFQPKNSNPNFQKLHEYFDFYSEKISLLQGERNLQCYSAMMHGIQIRKKKLSHFDIIYDAPNFKLMLTTRQLAEKMNRESYFKNIVKFVNFQDCMSTFKERLLACSIMTEIAHIQTNHDQLSPIIGCLKYLLDYYIDGQKQCSVDTIPIIITNLFILEALTQAEVISYFQRIIKLELNDGRSKALLLYRCSMIITWVVWIIDSKYQICSLAQDLADMLTQQFNRLSQANKDDEMLALFRSIFYPSSNLGSLDLKEYLKLGESGKMFEGSNFRRQLYIYYLLNIYRYHFFMSDYKAAAKLIMLINKQKSTMKSSPLFVTQLVFANYYKATSNIQMLQKIYEQFSKCIDNPLIVQRFYLFAIHCQLNFHKENKSRIDYYKKIATILRAQPLKSQKKIIQYLSFIYFFSQKNVDQQERQAKQQIYQQLRRRLPLDLVTDFNQFYQKFKFNKFYFYSMCRKLAILFFVIYADRPQLSPIMLRFKGDLQQKISQIQCLQCQQIALKVTMMIETQVLHNLGDFKKIITIYTHYVNSKTLHRFNDKMFYLLEIVRYSLKVPEFFSKIEEPIELFFHNLNDNNLWVYIITLPRPSCAFQALTKHLFFNNNISQFFPIQEYLVQNLRLYKSKKYALSYSQFLVQLSVQLAYLPQLEKEFVLQFQRALSSLPTNNYFATILYSMLMVLLPIKGIKGKKPLIIYICKSIGFLFPFVRTIVIGHLFYYLLQPSKEEMPTPQRKIKYYYQQYLKNTLSKVLFSQYRRRMSNINAACNNQKEAGLLSHLKKYYYMLQTKLSEVYSVQGFCPSPLQ